MGQELPAAGACTLGAVDLGMAYSLLEEVTINLTIEPPELTQHWGNRLLEGTHKTCAHQDPRERSSDCTRDLPRLTRDIQESQVEVWVGSGLLQGWEH